MKKIQIAQIVHSLTLGGGIQHVVYSVVKKLDRKKYEVIVCCLAGRGELADELEKIGIEVIVLSGKSSLSPLNAPKNLMAIWQLTKMLRERRIQVVETHDFYAGALGRIAALLAKVPVILWMIHSRDSWKGSGHIVVDRVLSRYTDRIITNSQMVKKFTSSFENLKACRFTVIHNGVDLSLFGNGIDLSAKRKDLGVDRASPVICSVGRLIPEKGYTYLVEAMPQVVNHFPEAKLLIIGDDSEFEESSKRVLKDLILQLNLSDSVSLLGWRNDVPQILSISDIFVLPSLREGCGLAIAEAMAAEKPVVVSDIDAIPEIVEDGKAGILVPIKDSDALAGAILYLLRNPHKATQMGNWGRERVEQYFSDEVMVRKRMRLYDSFIDER